MKIAFVPTGVSGVMFYRVWQYAEAMRGMGHDVAVIRYSHRIDKGHPWEAELADQQLRVIVERDLDMACEWADIVVWMTLHTPMSLDLFLSLKVRHGKPFVTEQDDFLFSLPSGHQAHPYWLPGEPHTIIGTRQILASDAMIVSTPYLLDLYSPHHKEIYVVENAIDTTVWPKRTDRSFGSKVRLGWVGGGSHFDDLAIIKEPVFEILEKYNNVEFVCLHGVPEFFKHHKKIKINHDFKTIDRYPKHVGKFKFDIGLAPLVDNDFNRGKSNLRFLEYSAMGIPTIASDVENFRLSIAQGKTGFLCQTHEDWVRHMSCLIENKGIRMDMGRKALKEVKSRWNPQGMARKYIKYLENISHAKSDKVLIGDANRRVDRRPERRSMVGVAEAK